MQFEISSIQTVAACDALTLMLTKEKSDHEFRKLSLSRQLESLSSNSSENGVELAKITAELSTIIPIIDTMQPGEYKTDLITKKMKLEVKKFELENKVAEYDIKSKCEKTLDVTNAESAVSNTEALLAAVDARRTELSS